MVARPSTLQTRPVLNTVRDIATPNAHTTLSAQILHSRFQAANEKTGSSMELYETSRLSSPQTDVIVDRQTHRTGRPLITTLTLAKAITEGQNCIGLQFSMVADRGYSSCCSEMDIWEANSQATAYTPHVCTTTGWS